MAVRVSVRAPLRVCAVQVLPVCVILLLFTDYAPSREVSAHQRSLLIHNYQAQCTQTDGAIM